MILREYKLAKPVFDYFKSQGYKIYAEYKINNRNVDFIATKKNTIVAIELKMSLNKKVIKQALSCKKNVDYIYIVVPTNPKKENLKICQEYNLGVISIKNSIKKIIEPKKCQNIDIKRKEIILQHTKKILESDQSGKPMLEGEGPAQLIKKEVEILRNQGFSFKDIYNTIPNHYSSHQSLQSSMSAVNKRKYINRDIKNNKKIFEKILIKYLKIQGIWNDQKSFLTNKKSWLSLEGEFVHLFSSVLSLNKSKDYEALCNYLNDRVGFYKNKDNQRLKSNILEKLNKEKFIEIKEPFEYLKKGNIYSMLIQENLIKVVYIPKKNNRIILEFFDNLNNLKKQYNDYISGYVLKNHQY